MGKSRAILVVALVVGCGSATVALAAGEYELKGNKWVYSYPPALGSAPGELAIIRQEIEQGDGKDALAAADQFLKKYPDDLDVEEVMHLAGQAEILRERYFQAYERFEKQLTRFPNGQHSERALEKEFEVAEAFLAGKKRLVLGFLPLSAQDDGVSILEKIAEHAPGSKLAEKALMRVADYHFGAQEYLESVKDYDRYLETFSKSPRAAYAMSQAAKASHSAYRGPEYDDAPLLEAQQRYRMYQDRFPLLAERANVPQTLERIRSSLAEKQYGTAAFYERTHRLDAAKFYYRAVIEQYPATQWEKQSRMALVRLGVPAGTAKVFPASAPAANASSQPAAASQPVVKDGPT